MVPPMVRCGLPTSSTNLTPFFRSAVGAKVLRPRPGYNQRAEVDRELGAVAVADGERDDAGADSINCVFPGGCDLFRR